MRNSTRSKLTKHDETLVHELFEDGMPVSEIAEKFEVSPETIRRAIKRRTWTEMKKDMTEVQYVAVSALEKIINLPYSDSYSAREIAWSALGKVRGMIK